MGLHISRHACVRQTLIWDPEYRARAVNSAHTSTGFPAVTLG